MSTSYYIFLETDRPISSVQFTSVAHPCPTLCNPMDCSTSGFPVHHQLPNLAQSHVHWVGLQHAGSPLCHQLLELGQTCVHQVSDDVHWVGDVIQPSPSPPGLQSFPASGSFPMSQFFMSGSQSIGASASTSVLPMNIQDWFPLGWTVWIFLQSKELSRVFSNTTIQRHQFSGFGVHFRHDCSSGNGRG